MHEERKAKNKNLKVSFIVTVCSKYSRALTFPEFFFPEEKWCAQLASWQKK